MSLRRNNTRIDQGGAGVGRAPACLDPFFWPWDEGSVPLPMTVKHGKGRLVHVCLPSTSILTWAKQRMVLSLPSVTLDGCKTPTGNSLLSISREERTQPVMAARGRREERREGGEKEEYPCESPQWLWPFLCVCVYREGSSASSSDSFFLGQSWEGCERVISFVNAIRLVENDTVVEEWKSPDGFFQVVLLCRVAHRCGNWPRTCMILARFLTPPHPPPSFPTHNTPGEMWKERWHSSTPWFHTVSLKGVLLAPPQGDGSRHLPPSSLSD